MSEAKYYAILVSVGFLMVVGANLPSVSSKTKVAQEGGRKARGEVISAKPLLVFGKNNVAYVLNKADVRQFGGRSFVVGLEVKEVTDYTRSPLWNGARVWVPMDAVTQMVELESLKSLKKEAIKAEPRDAIKKDKKP